MMDRATPITSALKRKYSPFKKEESKAQKESKQMLADETGVYVQTKIKTPGAGGTAADPGSSGRVIKAAENQMSDEAWKEYLANETPEQKQKRYQREQDEGLREGFKPATEGTEGTEGSEKTSEVKLKTKVEGTSMTPENLRRQIRKGKIAANQEKRATAQAARTQAKLDKLEEAGDTSSPKYKRLQAKLKQKNQIASLAGEAGKNVMRQTEEGKALGQTYVKGQRDTMQSEVDDQSTLEAKTSGPGAAKKFFGNLPKDISSDLQMKFSPAKFKSYGKNSPMKKLSDLSGGGSPAKYGNKKSPYKMKGYGSQRY